MIGVSDASATATAVFPTPVGPTMTGVRCWESGPTKTAFQFFLWQLDHRRAAVHVVRGQRRGQQPRHELTHLVAVERLTRLDGGAAGIRGREPLQTILPAAEPAAREVGHEL